MRVLVVEDEAEIRMLVCDLLADAGHACLAAADAAQALALLDDGRCWPDAMVTDFNLGPGLDGQALAAEVARRLPRLATVFITGNPEAFDNYPMRPWQRLVAKPFAGADLVQAVTGLGSARHLPALRAAVAAGLEPCMA